MPDCAVALLTVELATSRIVGATAVAIVFIGGKVRRTAVDVRVDVVEFVVVCGVEDDVFCIVLALVVVVVVVVFDGMAVGNSKQYTALLPLQVTDADLSDQPVNDIALIMFSVK
jgi:hypothetical protein